MQGMQLGQRALVGIDLAAGKGLSRRAATVGGPPGVVELADQPGDLCSRQAAGICQIALD